MATLRDASTKITLSRDVGRAATPWRRTIGFLLSPSIAPERGLWFERCRAIHTLGMRSALDVLFLDRDGCVIAVEARVRPNRLLVARPRTATILECGPGFLERHAIEPGQHLELI